MKLSNYDLEHIVAGASIAGYMAHAGEIGIPLDAELTDFLLMANNAYKAEIEIAYNNNTRDAYKEHEQVPIWSDYISDALKQNFNVGRYGAKE